MTDKVIDIDVITGLKACGKHDEATRLLKEFRASIEMEKKELLRKLFKEERDERRKLGLCTINGCPNMAEEGRIRCERCNERGRSYSKKLKERQVCAKSHA